ncbi:MFS transporter [Clostridium estertheticum]|uniref:MFS transporter n=1 Tax=Clostridium estertheticum TaxID=238834 RepID=UPI001C0D05B3|nr:MFS transporter [Clostridium estertheticum]MBU3179322.1 MFS transporter [Clostridium estertheticum]
MKNFIIKTIMPLKNFLLLWSGQSLSQLGSAMTSFALIIWAYKKQGTVMSISLLSVFSYLPYVIVSLFAGAVIDRFQKKKTMLVCEAIATICSFCAFILISGHNLQIWHLYLINSVSGFMNAFQLPAVKVSIKLIVTKENYTRISGLQSLSDSTISIFTPILATTIVSFWGINIIFAVDLITFIIGFLLLLFYVKIPLTNIAKDPSLVKSNFIRESLQGFSYLNKNKCLLYLMFFMAGINFIASMVSTLLDMECHC